VAHVPPRISGFKHAGNEVWYKNKVYDGVFTECANVPFTQENDKCSNSLWLKTGITAHVSYLGISVSGSCTRRQPSGTLVVAASQTVIESLAFLQE
jgi:hypothetical protein